MRSLNLFSIYLILPAALGPGVYMCNRKERKKKKKERKKEIQGSRA
jgi:hypothetical protein